MRYNNYMRIVVQFLIDALFPPQCIPCGKKLLSASRFKCICEECFSRIPIRTGFTCSLCGARQPSLINECHKNKPLIAAATEYTNREAQLLIRALKYNGSRGASSPLGSLLLQYLSTRTEITAYDGFLLIPVPLHTRKIRMRGFNQSALLTQELVRALPQKFLYSEKVLVRARNTPSQTTKLTHAEREANMRDAFVVQNTNIVKGKIVFLVDDVSTSGSTIREAARVVKRAGARSVMGLVVAKA